ncbi:MAG: nickel pincer cofactor biosynthesis protein LarB [Planctomycetaceae bacterium]
MTPDPDQLKSILNAYLHNVQECAAVLKEFAKTAGLHPITPDTTEVQKDDTSDPKATSSQPMVESDSARTAEISGAVVDLGRSRRCGFPEVVFAEGKPADLVLKIFEQQSMAGQSSFATRVSDQHVAAVRRRFPQAEHHAVARTLLLAVPNRSSAESVTPFEQTTVRDQTPVVCIVTAGSCDAAVAFEASETLRWMKIPHRVIEDVGVAGPQRLLQHVPLLRQMRAVVCVAGMEAALPSVLGGHVSCPVIGVPTSVGYGASFAGVTAMLSMLTCCASNVVTVNIDAGFRGGYVAGLIASQAVPTVR